MNIFSVAIVLVILSFGLLGLKRGILKELVSFVGTILVFVLAFLLKNPIAMFLSLHLPAVRVTSALGPLSSLSILFYQLIAFLILLILFHFILRILLSITGLLGKILNATILLALPNQLLGFLTGLIEGYLIVFVVLNVLMIPLSGNELFMESSVRNFVMNETPILKNSFGDINIALNDILTMDKTKEENDINLTVIDTMLKYKIVTVEDVEKLKDGKKLDDITGLDQVINKYKEDSYDLSR